MKVALALLAVFGSALTAEIALAGRPASLVGMASVCPRTSPGSSAIPASGRTDLVRVGPAQADSERIKEYLSFHADAVGGAGVTTILSRREPRSASN